MSRSVMHLRTQKRAYFHRKAFIDMFWRIVRTLLLLGLCFVILYPLLYMVSCAFRTQEDMRDPTVMWIPHHVTLKTIQKTAEAMEYGTTFLKTMLLNIGCSLVQVMVCAVTGYGFARFRFRGRRLLFGVVLMQILVPSQIISIPQYMEFRYCLGLQPLAEKLSPTFGDMLNLINTPLTMYLPAMTGNGIRAGLMIFIFRQFFRGLPKELEEAAYLDGCGAFRTFWQVMAPNAASAFLTVFLFSVVFYWNDYYVSSAFFTRNETMALMLRNLKTLLWGNAAAEISPREQIIWLEAGCLLAILPLLVMYAFLQRYFTEGIEHSGLAG